jgi:hypothetical protein
MNETTWKKVRRGSGVIKMGQPLSPGKRKKQERMDINVAFYIDRSGSMSGCIENVYSACFTIAESLKKQFGRDSVIDKVEFKTYVFDDVIEEIQFGKTAHARGGTMNFDKLLGYVGKFTKNYLINIIITDAGFSVPEQQVKEYLREIDGMLIFITNCESAEVKRMANETEFKTKLVYILADNNFSI